MKYFFPLLMVLLILMGLTLTFTPFIADYFIPAPQTSFRRASANEVQAALANWLNTRPHELSKVQGIQQLTPERKTAWFTFEVDRVPVEQFIRALKLKQLDITPELMQQNFKSVELPVDWWQPESLGRQTFFTGVNADQTFSLIYNAEVKKGLLVITTMLTNQPLKR